MKYSIALTSAIENYLRVENLQFAFDNDKGRFLYEANLSWRLQVCKGRITVRENDIIIRFVSPFVIPEEKRNDVSEYLMRANYARMTGAFEMDYSDGEFAFRNALFCGCSMPDEETIKFAIQTAKSALDEFGDGVVDIISGNSSPVQALEEVERKQDERLNALQELQDAFQSLMDALEA